MRGILDKIFTVLTASSVILLSFILVAVLGPMIWRGSGAVVFKGTVEFRRMQMALFNRGSSEVLEKEIAEVQKSRAFIYDTIDKFRKGIDTDSSIDTARKMHREFGQELREKGISGDLYTELRSVSKDIRNKLEEAFASRDIKLIRENVDYVLRYKSDERLKGTVADGFFSMAADFLAIAEKVDLSRFQKYVEGLEEVEIILFGSDEINGLLGPRPDEPARALLSVQYGATRWDQAQNLLDRLLVAEQWIEQGPGKPLVKKRTPRVEQFAGTALEPLFKFVPEHLQDMLNPKLTFYWQYFIDGSYVSHFFGGVGPEIIGTLLITVLGMLFTVPLGIISAAYLVECSNDGQVIRIIRMCINTLAGVPSIVFGLFGLAFFVLFLFPLFGFESKPCILAASLTLAVLTLPVMIRASEEAIRSVPQTYKEASLALGASRFRTFVTVVLPAALPGVLTGVILSLSRIAGETAPILFTGAVSSGPIPKSIFDSTTTLSYGSYDIAVGDRLSMMVPHNQYGMVMTLVGLILCLNAVAIVLRSRVFKKLKGH